MVHTKLTTLLSVLLLAVLGAGCASSGSGDDVTPDSSIVGPTWRLQAFGDDDDMPSVRSAGITALFGADGRVTGNAGCNNYFGSYEAGREVLAISQVGATKMACGETATRHEISFLDALGAVRSWDRDGDELELEDASGATILSFVATDEALLTGTVTYLPRIALPPNATVVVRLLDVSRADAPSVTLAQEAISTERRSVPIPFTLRYDPSDVQARHSYAVRAEIRNAQGGLEWTTDTHVPVLTGGAPSDGVEVRVVQVVGDADTGGLLVGPMWRLVEMTDAGGTVRMPESGEAYTIQFGTDGRYSGQADCNRYGGEYEIEAGGELDLDRSLSTLAACAPPSSSGEFFGVFNEVEGYTLGDDRLTLRTDGRAMLVFVR